MEQVGEAHVNHVGAAAQRDDQATVRIKGDMKLWRAAFAANAREHSLKKSFAAGDVSREFRARSQHSGLNSCAAREAGLLSSWRFPLHGRRLRCLQWRRQDCPCKARPPAR